MRLSKKEDIKRGKVSNQGQIGPHHLSTLCWRCQRWRWRASLPLKSRQKESQRSVGWWTRLSESDHPDNRSQILFMLGSKDPVTSGIVLRQEVQFEATVSTLLYKYMMINLDKMFWKNCLINLCGTQKLERETNHYTTGKSICSNSFPGLKVHIGLCQEYYQLKPL